MQKKDKTVSIARGIAIIAMVVGHAVPHDTLLATFIYKWHMPLFFFFSGYFFSVDKYSFGKFAYRKIKSLYIPYILWSLLFLSVHNLLIQYHISDGDILDRKTIIIWFYRIIFKMWAQPEPFLGAFWFLVQLLRVNLLIYLIFYIKKIILKNFKLNTFCDNLIDIFVASVLLLVSILFCNNDYSIFQINDITFLGMFFFVIGNKLRNVDITQKNIYIISLLIVLCLGNTFHEMINLKSDYIIMYAIVAICGIIFIYNISKIIDRKYRYVNVVFAYIGDKSLSIMTMHFIAFKIISYIIILTEDLSINILSSHPVIENVQWYWTVLYILIGVTVPLLLERCYSCFKSFALSKHNK